MGNKILKELLDTGVFILIVLLATWLVITFVGQRISVDGASMETTLNNGDQLIADKISYRFHDPQRYDIVIFFPYENDRKTYYIKRIIGLPGETVQIDEQGTIYVDGEALEEHYGKEVISPQTVGRAISPVTLGGDEYFVMGDNRNHSLDSREEVVGNVKRSSIIGRAWARIWPLGEFGKIKH